MSLSRRFFLYFIAFALVLTAAGGWLAWRAASTALDQELDEKLRWVAGAAADVGFDATVLAAIQPGDEPEGFYTSNLARLKQLQQYVSAAYIFHRDPSGISYPIVVSTAGPDSLPIGRALPFLAAYRQEIEQAWRSGEATSPLFDVDGRSFKYGFVRMGSAPPPPDAVMMAVLIPANYTGALVRLRRSILLGSVAATVVAGLLAFLLATSVIGPMAELSRAALRIQRGRMDAPIGGTHREDEVGQLARAMDRMRLGIEERDRQLRLMLAQVAHEIRNPLGGMELLATVAKETSDEEERNRLLGRIREEVTALNEIISDFLSYAKPTQPQVEIHDIRGPIRDAVEIVAAEAEAAGKEVTVGLPERPLSAEADPDHVKQVVLNLAQNAAQAGQRVWVEAEQQDTLVRITVRDDGPGIDQELGERVFDPFVTDKEQGSGLGLAIVKRLVEANRGSLEMDAGGSVVGSGAEFRVYFQRPQPSHPAPPLDA